MREREQGECVRGGKQGREQGSSVEMDGMCVGGRERGKEEGRCEEGKESEGMSE